jgi:tRNA threonylcarbamoyladenosine biosynthesis protein TsaB
VGETVAILVMDTATEALAVAIGNEGKVIAGSVFRVPRGHSRILQPAISHLLTHAGVGIENITGIAVGIGPGSYTGVRLAVSTAKAMAITLCVPLYPVPTLFGLAGAVLPLQPVRSAVVMPLLFARRGRAFGALYLKRRDGTFECIKGSTVMPVEDWCTVAMEAARALGSAGAVRTTEAVNGETVSAAGASAEQGNLNADLIVVHDFLPKHGVLNLLASLETASASVTSLSSIAAELPASFVHLVSSGLVPAVTGEAVHSVVPEYALEVEAVAKLKEQLRKGLEE